MLPPPIPPRPPRLILLDQDAEDTQPGIPSVMPPAPPKMTGPVTMPSPFPPGSLTPPPRKRRPWRWGALALAVLAVAGEVAHAVYPALTGPLELVRGVVESLQ